MDELDESFEKILESYKSDESFKKLLESYKSYQSDESYELSTIGTILLLSHFILTPIMFVISTPCLIIHMCKFFRSASPQSLASKNLTLYCFYLQISNTVNLIFEVLIFVDEEVPIIGDGTDDLFKFIWYYFLLATAILKSLIALDICLCFRNIAIYLRRSIGSQAGKFSIYFVLSAVMPLPCMILRFYQMNENNADMGRFTLLATIRILRLIPVIAAFWYLRSASIDKKELWTKFSLHMRLLILIGGSSSVVSLIEMSFRIFYVPEDWSDQSIASIGELINIIGSMLEGILIGIFFTFKKDTFKSVGSNRKAAGESRPSD